MPTSIEKIEKWLHRDRLIFVKNKELPIKVIQLIPDLKEHGRHLNEHDLNKP